MTHRTRSRQHHASRSTPPVSRSPLSPWIWVVISGPDWWEYDSRQKANEIATDLILQGYLDTRIERRLRRNNATNRDATRSHARDVSEATVRDAMIEGVAEAFWLPAWANYVENEEGESLGGGVDIADIAENPPPTARLYASRFLGLLRHLNSSKGKRISLHEIWRRASAADGRSADARELGYYLAMQSQGHGVSWFDNHEEFEIRLPRYLEVNVFRQPRGRFAINVSGLNQFRTRP